MYKLLLAIILLTPLTAHAQRYQQNNHHYYNHGGGGSWVAPFVGGAIIGGIVGGALVAPPAPVYVPRCWWEPTGYYDTWGRPIMQRLCQ